MENKGHSRAKKLTKGINVSFEGDFSDLQIEAFRKRLPAFNVVNPNDSSLRLIAEADQLSAELQRNSDDFIQKRVFLKNDPTNFASLANLTGLLNKYNHRSYLNKNFLDKKSHNKTYQQAQVRFESQIKKSKNLKGLLKSLLEITHDDHEIDQLFDESQTIETALFEILKLSGFSTYTSCQLVIHEKGKAEAENLFLDIDNELNHAQITARKFNQLFKLIRKSKNKHFNQTQILDPDLHIVGPFLAKEIETKEHNLIFIISRNGFLSPTQEEQSYFEKIVPSLKQVFAFILMKSKLSQREKLLASIFNSYPLPIIVSVGDNIIFKNKLVTHEILSKLSSPNEESPYEVYSLGLDKKL